MEDNHGILQPVRGNFIMLHVSRHTSRKGKYMVFWKHGENRGGWLGDVSFLGNGIYKSTDGGLSWDSLHITTSNTPQADDSDFDFVWNIVTDPSNDSMDVLYVSRMEIFIKVQTVV